MKITATGRKIRSILIICQVGRVIKMNRFISIKQRLREYKKI